MWIVYILECSDKTLYTGITTDLDRRIFEHNDSKLGAKYTRGRRPVKLFYSKIYKTRGQAQRREYEIKQKCQKEKLDMIKIANIK